MLLLELSSHLQFWGGNLPVPGFEYASLQMATTNEIQLLESRLKFQQENSTYDIGKTIASWLKKSIIVTLFGMK